MLKPRQAIFDTYWYFASERQKIFYRKLAGELAPWTEDPTLQRYKFCNVYRASDRVSQFLIRDVIYSGKFSDDDTLFRIFLFRLLNRSETWQRLEQQVGEISLATFSLDKYAKVLGGLKLASPIYGNAFILCANKAFGYDEKHRNHLALLEQVFVQTNTGKDLLAAKSLKQLFERLRELPLIGNFMAYQLAIDFNYSEVFNFSENDFTIAGPGSRRGIAKCFESIGKVSEAEVIMWMVGHQDEQFRRLGLDFQRLGNRPLQAIDCQGLFCEVDKYCRVAFPDLASNRVRIKASYHEASEPIDYFFPPKWGIMLDKKVKTRP